MYFSKWRKREPKAAYCVIHLHDIKGKGKPKDEDK